MSDPLAPLPADDESPAVLLQDAADYLATAVPDLDISSAGDLVRAFLAAGADEDAVQYALLRETVDDWALDFGLIYDVPVPRALPASTTTTWTAHPDRDGILLAGTDLVVDAPQGLTPFEVLATTPIPAGTSVSGILVQAIVPGTVANQATGPVLLDQRPAWAIAITVDEPATGGSDAITPAEHLEQIKRAAKKQGVAPVNDLDLELAVLDIPGIDRALVLDNYDDATSTADVEGVASVYPLDPAGESITSATMKAQVAQLVAGDGHRILGGRIVFGEGTYTTIKVTTVCTLESGYDPDAALAGAQFAIDNALNPALHGRPDKGETRRWRQRRTIRRFTIAGALEAVDGIDDIESLTLTVTTGPGTVNAAGDVELAGSAPLPRAATPDITLNPADL